MDSSTPIESARRICHHLVLERFPDERNCFDDVWDAMLPAFQELEKTPPGEQQFSPPDLSSVAGLEFGDARDWGLPIILMTVVATMLQLWESESTFSKANVRSSIKLYAEYFGAPPKLQELLDEIVPPLCFDLYKRMEGTIADGEGNDRRQKIEAKTPKQPIAADYVVLRYDHKRDELTLEELKEFKKQHDPEDYFLWLDESQEKSGVFVNNKSVPLTRQLRRVLYYLVENSGQYMTHSQIKRACAKTDHDYKTNPKRLAHAWIAKLSAAGKGQFDKLIDTGDETYAYVGPPEYCIIKRHSGR